MNSLIQSKNEQKTLKYTVQVTQAKIILCSLATECHSLCKFIEPVSFKLHRKSLFLDTCITIIQVESCTIRYYLASRYSQRDLVSLYPSVVYIIYTTVSLITYFNSIQLQQLYQFHYSNIYHSSTYLQSMMITLSISNTKKFKISWSYNSLHSGKCMN